jgi:hypothetical protein
MHRHLRRISGFRAADSLDAFSAGWPVRRRNHKLFGTFALPLHPCHRHDELETVRINTMPDILPWEFGFSRVGEDSPAGSAFNVRLGSGQSPGVAQARRRQNRLTAPGGS